VLDGANFENPPAQGWQRPLGWLRRAGQFFFALSFSSLTRRIVSLNLAGLVALVASILYLSQFRAGLIDARAQSLQISAEIIAGAIAASATVDTNSITIDPDRLLDLKPGETYGAPDEYSGLDFPINPERVAPVLRRLISPTKTRARIFDRDGGLILDSRNLYGRGDVLRFELPPPSVEKPGIAERTTIAIRTWLNRGDLPLYRELGPENGNGYQEVVQALNGQKSSMVRVNDRGEVIVSVAVPVQRFRAVHGALMLSTQGDDIDQMVTAERLAILKVGGVASAVMIVLSLLLASTIAGPVRRLADSAERVRRRIRTRVEIPDFTRRRDEIGHLSGALRDMTDALYNRIEAIDFGPNKSEIPQRGLMHPIDVAACQKVAVAAKKLRERKRHKHENEIAENREDLTLQEPLEPRQDHNIAKTAKTKPLPTGRPHALTIILSLIPIVIGIIVLYWNIGQPDIRYIPSLGPETMTVVESKLDSAGNFVHNFRLRPTFTNYSMKPGFIDKVEFVPQSIATLPETKITSINRTFIFWHQKKRIEITFLMTVPTDAANNLNTTRELAVDQALAVYDNTGKRVDRLPNGTFGRLRFNFKDIVNVHLNGVR